MVVFTVASQCAHTRETTSPGSVTSKTTYRQRDLSIQVLILGTHVLLVGLGIPARTGFNATRGCNHVAIPTLHSAFSVCQLVATNCFRSVPAFHELLRGSSEQAALASAPASKKSRGQGVQGGRRGGIVAELAAEVGAHALSHARARQRAHKLRVRKLRLCRRGSRTLRCRSSAPGPGCTRCTRHAQSG